LTAFNISKCVQYAAGVKNTSTDQDRLALELVGLCTVLMQVKWLAIEETGQNSQLDSGRASPLSALNERLHVCGEEMKHLRTALGDEMDSFEMGSLEATARDGNSEAALVREMEALGKDLGRKGGMQALIAAMEVDHTYVTLRQLPSTPC
jgi:hypothetical protein